MELARNLEILVAPTFVRNGRKLVGYRPYNELKAFVRGEASPG
jgi:protein-disulfide isomerase